MLGQVGGIAKQRINLANIFQFQVLSHETAIARSTYVTFNGNILLVLLRGKRFIRKI
jgi:hypothetical protein